MAIQPIRVVISGIDQLANTLGQSQKRLEKFGRSVSNIGKTMSFGLTLPIAAFGISTIKIAGEFEASMNRVQVLSRATGTELVSLSEQARFLGATTKYSASEAADAMGYLAQAGFKTNEVMGAMTGTLDLAAASNMGLAETADIASNVLRGYGIRAEEMTRVADIMAQTMASTNTNVEQLGEAMKFVAPLAGGMKIPIEEVSAALGNLGNAGIQGAMGGTALRGMLAQLVDPTREARAILAKLEIPKSRIVDSVGNVRSLVDVISALEEKGATTADIMGIFNVKVGPAVAALVKQGGASLRNFTKELENSGGAAKRIADVQMKGLLGQLKNLKSAYEEFQLVLADTGIFTSITNAIIKLVEVFRNLGETNPQLLKTMIVVAGVVAALGPLLWIAGQLVTTIGTFSGAIASAGGIIPLLTNPIGLTIAGILALIGIITYLSTHMESKLSKIIIWFFPLVGIVSWIIARWSRILPFFKLLFYGILFLLKKFYTLAKPILDPIINLFSFLGGLLTGVLDKALSALEKLAGLALPDWLLQKIGMVGGTGALAGGGTLPMSPLVERAGSAINRNENVTKIKIENRANVKVRTETEKGSVDTEVDRGLIK